MWDEKVWNHTMFNTERARKDTWSSRIDAQQLSQNVDAFKLEWHKICWLCFSSKTLEGVKHSGLSHKKSTNWTKISMSACKALSILHPRDLTWYGPGANLSIAQDTVVNFQFMFEVVIFYDAVYVVNCIYCAAILENIMILSSLSSAEVFHDVETTEMHNTKANKHYFEASKPLSTMGG